MFQQIPKCMEQKHEIFQAIGRRIFQLCSGPVADPIDDNKMPT